MNFIECTMAYMSTSKESNYDLQLGNKGCWDVYTSFDKHMVVEDYEGDCLRERVRPLILFYQSSVKNLNFIKIYFKGSEKEEHLIY